MIRAKTVDEYISKAPDWAVDILVVLRKVALECGLSETIKWGGPVYMHKSNVIGLGAFKNFVSIWFYQGVFLEDHNKVLVAAQDKTKGLRQWRFEANEVIDENFVREYIEEAKQNDEKGRKIKQPKREKKKIPLELETLLKSSPELNDVFEKLSLSHQNEYSDYISEAKREETRKRRASKCLEMIKNNQSLNQKYSQ